MDSSDFLTAAPAAIAEIGRMCLSNGSKSLRNWGPNNCLPVGLKTSVSIQVSPDPLMFTKTAAPARPAYFSIVTLLTRKSPAVRRARALDSLRPNIREVELPRPYPDQPGNSWRRDLFSESLSKVAEVVEEILETAEAECGGEFRENLQIRIVNRLRRRSKTRLARPDRKLNLAMIDILRKTSGHCTPRPVELKTIAPEGKNPVRWTTKARVQLNRFCDRVYRVWRELENPPPPLEKIRFLPKAHAFFLAECSLMFPKDLCVAQEAIERAAKLSRKRKLNKPLSTRSNKSHRR